MIVVLEGADGTGKTTLAKELERSGFRYEHEGPPEPGQNLFELHTAKLLAVRDDENVVFDRLHLSALVYAEKVRGGRDPVSVEEVRLINRLLFAKGGALVYADPGNRTIFENWGARATLGQEYVTKRETLTAIVERYRELYCTELVNLPNVFRYQLDSFRNAVPMFVDLIWTNVRKGRFAEGIVGSPTASYLFVGERSSEERDLAFYATTRSAGFLNRALRDAGYSEAEISFTNAFDYQIKPRDFGAIYLSRRGLKFIALGASAATTLDRYGVPHLRAEHPQYVKRFRAGEVGYAGYVSRLRLFRGVS